MPLFKLSGIYSDFKIFNTMSFYSSDDALKNIFHTKVTYGSWIHEKIVATLCLFHESSVTCHKPMSILLLVFDLNDRGTHRSSKVDISFRNIKR
jgi:hypothetical protein